MVMSKRLTDLAARKRVDAWLAYKGKPAIPMSHGYIQYVADLQKAITPTEHRREFKTRSEACRWLRHFAKRLRVHESEKIKASKPKPERPAWNKDWKKAYDGFYVSADWKRIRYQALKRDKGICQCCGASAATGAQMNVDHIEALSKRWDLRLTLSNLQTLCAQCNEGKGGNDRTNWRENDPPYPDNVVSFTKWHGL